MADWGDRRFERAQPYATYQINADQLDCFRLEQGGRNDRNRRRFGCDPLCRGEGRNGDHLRRHSDDLARDHGAPLDDAITGTEGDHHVAAVHPALVLHARDKGLEVLVVLPRGLGDVDNQGYRGLGARESRRHQGTRGASKERASPHHL